MSVASILQALAENAGQAQLRKGAIYGGLVSDVASVPAAAIADKEKQRLVAAQQARENAALTIRQNEDTRASTTFGQQQTEYAKQQKKDAIHEAALNAGFANAGGDPAKFDVKAAMDFATKNGEPALAQSIADFHRSVQKPALPDVKLGANENLVSGDPANIDPATGQRRVVASGPPPTPTVASLDARQQFLLTKQRSGVPLTKAEQDEMGAFQDRTAPKTRSAEDQALDAFAKSLNDPKKTKAEDLTYADRQTFDKNKAAITSSTQFQQHMRERQYDNANPAPVKAADQNKLEQEYRTVLARGLSSRSGGLGGEDAKVQQANHLTALIDASYDPKTDTYNIPRVQQTELAMGLAKLVSPGGVVAQKTVDDINQATAKGDIGKALTYITGTPFNGTTQDLVKMYRDSIVRQGEVAQTNREGEMAYLRGLAPTELEEERRKKLEATSLNPLRLSRVIQNKANGERKLQVSTDGGATWK